MECRTAEDLMAGLIDDELSPGHHALLEEHLQHCHTCAGLLSQLAAQPLTPPPMPPMGDDFWEKMNQVLVDEIEQTQLDPVAAQAAPPALRWRPSPALIVYAAALMLALGWGLYSNQQLQISQEETSMLRDTLDRERRLSVQPASIPVRLPGSGYRFANHTPSRGTF
jgi:anti-sigma factor RsiW